MCDLAKERKRIDELLFGALKGDAARACEDAGQLTQVAIWALREFYDDKCPDECILRRCEAFANSVFPRASAPAASAKRRDPVA